MNERIRKLMLESDCISLNISNKMERFAKLIVQECAEVCLEANDHKNILRHFGVEPDVNENLRNRSTYFGNDI